MQTVLEFIDMGGYGAYVWSAYAIAVVVLSGALFGAWREERAALRAAARSGSARRKDDDAAT